MHETLTALVSVEVDFLSDAAKATKGNALVNRIFWACQQKKGISPFSVQVWFFPCKEGSMTINWEICEAVSSGQSSSQCGESLLLDVPVI